MKKYHKILSLADGRAFARALTVYLGLGDKLIAVEVREKTAKCTFEQLSDGSGSEEEE